MSKPKKTRKNHSNSNNINIIPRSKKETLDILLNEILTKNDIKTIDKKIKKNPYSQKANPNHYELFMKDNKTQDYLKNLDFDKANIFFEDVKLIYENYIPRILAYSEYSLQAGQNYTKTNIINGIEELIAISVSTKQNSLIKAIRFWPDEMFYTLKNYILKNHNTIEEITSELFIRGSNSWSEERFEPFTKIAIDTINKEGSDACLNAVFNLNAKYLGNKKDDFISIGIKSSKEAARFGAKLDDDKFNDYKDEIIKIVSSDYNSIISVINTWDQTRFKDTYEYFLHPINTNKDDFFNKIYKNKSLKQKWDTYFALFVKDNFSKSNYFQILTSYFSTWYSSHDYGPNVTDLKNYVAHVFQDKLLSSFSTENQKSNLNNFKENIKFLNKVNLVSTFATKYDKESQCLEGLKKSLKNGNEVLYLDTIIEYFRTQSIGGSIYKTSLNDNNDIKIAAKIQLKDNIGDY